MLNITSGLYLVFRNRMDSSHGAWDMNKDKSLIHLGRYGISESPINMKEILSCKAVDYTPGRFLIIISELLKCFFKLWKLWITLQVASELLTCYFNTYASLRIDGISRTELSLNQIFYDCNDEIVHWNNNNFIARFHHYSKFIFKYLLEQSLKDKLKMKIVQSLLGKRTFTMRRFSFPEIHANIYFIITK